LTINHGIPLLQIIFHILLTQSLSLLRAATIPLLRAAVRRVTFPRRATAISEKSWSIIEGHVNLSGLKGKRELDSRIEALLVSAAS
jgi:hypothetical protein